MTHDSMEERLEELDAFVAGLAPEPGESERRHGIKQVAMDAMRAYRDAVQDTLRAEARAGQARETLNRLWAMERTAPGFVDRQYGVHDTAQEHLAAMEAAAEEARRAQEEARVRWQHATAAATEITTLEEAEQQQRQSLLSRALGAVRFRGRQ